GLERMEGSTDRTPSIPSVLPTPSTLLPEVPVHPPPHLRVRVAPRHGALVAGVHARPALDAVLELEVDAARLVFRVALRRAHVRRAVVGADRVADRRVDDDV